MEKYFVPMTDEIRKKQYPNGYFSAISKTQSKNSIFVYIFFGIILLIGLPMIAAGCWFAVICYQDDMTVVPGLIFAAVGLFFAGISIFMFCLVTKRRKVGDQGWLKKCAENSGYPESDIREFGNQVVDLNTFLLQLKGRLGALDGKGTGFFTKDYLYFTNIKMLVMKFTDIRIACFVNMETTIQVGNKIKPTSYLAIAVVSSNQNYMISEVKREAGLELLSMLQEKNPDIDIKDGATLSEQELSSLQL